MVAAYHTDSSSRQFVIRPNCSLDWRTTVVFFIAISTLSLGIATGFALMGAWMIFPFAGLEIVTLAIALYVCAQRTSRCEVVAIGEERITVMRGRRKPEEDFEFQRAWAQVIHERPVHDWYPGRLLIRSHGREVEVGSYLTEEERGLLACQLAEAIA